MIRSITLRNYRGHADTRIACGSLTVLVGENAVGKSTVLELVRDITRGMSATLPSDVLRHGADRMSYEVLHAWKGIEHTLRAEYERGPDGLLHGQLSVTDETGSVGYRPGAVMFEFDRRALAAPSVGRSAVPKLGPRGEGLASALAHLKLTDAARFDRIVENLRRIVPIVRDVTFSRVELDEERIRTLLVEGQRVAVPERSRVVHDALVFVFEDGPRVEAAHVSEGTLLSLGIFTAIETLERRDDVIEDGIAVPPQQVVLLDDLERGLHPRAQRDLVQAIRTLIEASPEVQIIATSHSPYLVDALEPAEVVVLGRGAGGIVAARTLRELPDARLHDLLASGELWMAEGDGWVSR